MTNVIERRKLADTMQKLTHKNNPTPLEIDEAISALEDFLNTVLSDQIQLVVAIK